MIFLFAGIGALVTLCYCNGGREVRLVKRTGRNAARGQQYREMWKQRRKGTLLDWLLGRMDHGS